MVGDLQDPQLNELEEKVAVSNQTLKAADEQYLQARAAVQIARAKYFPTLGVGSSVARDRLSQNRPTAGSGSKTLYNDFLLLARLRWEPDLWGRSAAPWNPRAPRPRLALPIWPMSI